jgi:hypothetical protein
MALTAHLQQSPAAAMCGKPINDWVLIARRWGAGTYLDLAGRRIDTHMVCPACR